MDSIALTRPADRDRELRAALATIVDRSREHLRSDLLAVVLSGSLAKGEGSTVATPDGSFGLLSDFDLHLVCRDGVDRDLAWLRASLDRFGFLRGGADVAIVGSEHFRGLGATLSGIQLLACARVLWKDEAWPGLPAAETMPPALADSALELLQNRCGELMWLDAEREHRDPLRLAYRSTRLLADAPIAYLAAVGAPWLDRAQRDSAFERALHGERGPAWLAMAWEEIRSLRDALYEGSLGGSELVERVERLRDEDAWRLARVLYVETLRRCVDARERAGSSIDPSRCGVEQARELSGRWLRRRPPLARLRLARRWAPLAPSANARWWSYGWGGIGPERIRAAAAGKILFDDDGFLQSHAAQVFSDPGGGLDAERATAQLWREWMLGDRRI